MIANILLIIILLGCSENEDICKSETDILKIISKENEWPVTKKNTILNFVPHDQKYIIQRFGKFHKVQDSGYFISIPLIDSIAYIVNMKEKVIQIELTDILLANKVLINSLSINISVQFINAYKVAYNNNNPFKTIKKITEDLTRDTLKKYSLDQILNDRKKINEDINKIFLIKIKTQTEEQGFYIKNYKITKILLPIEVQNQIDRRNEAEQYRLNNNSLIG